MIKVATILGTRPEIIRLSRVMPELDRCFDHTIIHTEQNYDYELNEVFFEELGLRKPDRFLNAAAAAASTASETVGLIIAGADRALRDLRPDAVLILGDTNSCLAGIAVKKLGIPLFHMEAGNCCFDERVPEEINRRIIDHISDVNLPYSDIAREYLLREGLPPDRIVKTGSPMHEVLHHYLPEIDRSDVLARLQLTEGGYFVVSLHREENVEADERLFLFCDLLDALAETYSLPIIVSTGVQVSPLVRLLKPMGLFDYVHLEMHARATLSDSGTITEESSILGFKALNLRDSHERPEGMEEAAVMLVGLRWPTVHAAIELLSRQRVAPAAVPADYRPLDVSSKVPRIILSYLKYPPPPSRHAASLPAISGRGGGG
jgi:UDP-N-acetylglucosamine 2-epimerase